MEPRVLKHHLTRLSTCSGLDIGRNGGLLGDFGRFADGLCRTKYDNALDSTGVTLCPDDKPGEVVESRLGVTGGE